MLVFVLRIPMGVSLRYRCAHVEKEHACSYPPSLELEKWPN